MSWICGWRAASLCVIMLANRKAGEACMMRWNKCKMGIRKSWWYEQYQETCSTVCSPPTVDVQSVGPRLRCRELMLCVNNPPVSNSRSTAAFCSKSSLRSGSYLSVCLRWCIVLSRSTPCCTPSKAGRFAAIRLNCSFLQTDLISCSHCSGSVNPYWMSLSTQCSNPDISLTCLRKEIGPSKLGTASCWNRAFKSSAWELKIRTLRAVQRPSITLANRWFREGGVIKQKYIEGLAIYWSLLKRQRIMELLLLIMGSSCVLAVQSVWHPEPHVYWERVRINALHLSDQVTGRWRQRLIVFVHLSSLVNPKAVAFDWFGDR